MSATIALVDDHPILRQGLCALLASEPELEVVGEAADARGGCAIADQAKPSVMIVDVRLPDGDGITLTHDILRCSPRTKVLVLSVHVGEFFISRALRSGISGYAAKSQPPLEIIGAIRTVARGETYLPPRFSHLLDRSPDRRRAKPSLPEEPFGELSRREREVFDLVLRGLTNEKIAGTLLISVKTVETHRLHINHKLAVNSPAQLIRLAALHGLLSK